MHPRFPQAELREVHERLGIRTEAWSPMGKRRAPLEEEAVHRGRERPRRLPRPGHPALARPARLAADPQVGRPQRQAQNLDVFGFELTDDEVAAITALGEADGRLFGGDPDTHEEM